MTIYVLVYCYTSTTAYVRFASALSYSYRRRKSCSMAALAGSMFQLICSVFCTAKEGCRGSAPLLVLILCNEGTVYGLYTYVCTYCRVICELQCLIRPTSVVPVVFLYCRGERNTIRIGRWSAKATATIHYPLSTPRSGKAKTPRDIYYACGTRL